MRVAWLAWVVLLAGCETAETRAWAQRQAELERRRAELLALTPARAAELRAAMELPALARARQVPARVFARPGELLVTVSGTAADCREAMVGLADTRWLLWQWRLRLEGPRCDWEARTGDDYGALEAALLLPPPRWAPPPPSVFSRALEETKGRVAGLADEVRTLEGRLGDAPALGVALPLVEAMRARPPPCEAELLSRELALEPERQGALLEARHDRLVHPLDPRGDFRLRGLVSSDGGQVRWRCPAE